MASGWDAQKMLDLYIHDYMVKKKMLISAEVFARETNVDRSCVVIDCPEGFLYEWWAVFWDSYSIRPQASQVVGNELQGIYPVVPQPGMNLLSWGQSIPMGGVEYYGTKNLKSAGPAGKLPMGVDSAAADMVAAKMYEEEHFKIPAKDFDQNIDVDKFVSSRPSSSNASFPNLKIPEKAPQQVQRENRVGVTLGRALTMDSTTICGAPKPMSPSTGLHDSGMIKGVDPLPLNRFPITGIELISPELQYPVLNSLLPVPNQKQKFQVPADQRQGDNFSHVVAQTPRKPLSSFAGRSSNLGITTRPRNKLSGNDGPMMIPTRQTAEKQTVVPMRQTLEQQMVAPIVQTAGQQQNDQPKQHQLYEDENNRKRKSFSYIQAEGNALSSEVAEADKTFDENFESFFSIDDDNADITGNSFSTLQRSSASSDKNELEEFSFKEVGSLHSSKSKVLCCQFSSDGKLLAAAGHEKRVAIWTTKTFACKRTEEGHSHLITDVRFKPNSTVFGTSSFDGTVQIWDAVKPNNSLSKLIGHNGQVMSLDFHPRKSDLLCSCDSNDVIRLWNIHKCTCTCIFKGATRQVRFQPRVGNLVAAASGNGISLFDVETGSLQYYLEGHVNEVRSLCWDTTGKYIASVSEDSARVWSIGLGGKCIHELHSNGNKFESCTFHPGYYLLMIIGCYQSIELWNPIENNRSLTVAAHNGIIAALANSPQNELIASASHDHYVKIWK